MGQVDVFIYLVLVFPLRQNSIYLANVRYLITNPTVTLSQTLRVIVVT